MKQKSRISLLGILALVMLLHTDVLAGVAVNYVKTIGQTNEKGQPFKTVGSRISVDKEGNLYLCGMVNSPWYSLMKLAPDGRVIWVTNCSGYANIVTAIDDEYVYVVSARELLRRFTLTSGKLDGNWGYGSVNWGPGEVKGEGFPRFKEPTSMIASGSCLYIVDRGGDELRRVDKTSGKEQPFKSRLMAVTPMDIARAKNGSLLLLTGESVFEIDADGNPGKGPIIDGLAGAVAIDVEPVDGKIYIALGGTPENLANTINEYTAQGKPTGVKLGHGGGFSGPWAADQFAFASGANDIAADPAGGVWVSNQGRNILPTIVHFDRQRKQDVLLMGLNGNGLAVDADLNVYVGGTCKISWDNKPIWTSGLVTFGDLKQYPTTGPEGWWFTVAYADASAVVVFNPAAQSVLALSPVTGALLSGPHKAGPARAFFAGEKSVFYIHENSIEKLNITTLDKPVKFFKPPDGVKMSDGGLAVSADGQRIFCAVGDKIVGYRTDGAKLWEVAARPPMVLIKDVLWVAPVTGAGVLALDAATGQSLGVFAGKDVDGRLSVAVHAIAKGFRDGKDYLFVAGQSQIQVFEVTAP